jgi:membrane protease YdiL (CAAX protease family)
MSLKNHYQALILNFTQNYQKIKETMQNIEKERHSWVKLIIIILFLLGLAAMSASGGDVKMNLDDRNFIATMKILQAVSVIFFFIAPAVLFATLFTKAKIRYLGILNRPGFPTLVISGLGMLLALPLINGLAELNQHMHLPASLHYVEEWMIKSEDQMKGLTEAFMRGTSVGTLFMNLFVVAFLAALSEELLFRGVIQNVLIECFKNKHVGVWLGAILFSAFHLQFLGFIPRMLMGAYLGYLFVWSGSLWPGIFAHFLNNGLAVYGAWLMNRGTISKDIDTFGADQQDWIYAVISGILVTISLVLVHRAEKKRQTKFIIPDEKN